MAYGKRYKSARNFSNIRLHFHFSAIHKRFPLLGVSVLKNHRTFARRQKRFAVVYIFRIQFNIYVYCECKPQPFSPVRESRERGRGRDKAIRCVRFRFSLAFSTLWSVFSCSTLLLFIDRNRIPSLFLMLVLVLLVFQCRSQYISFSPSFPIFAVLIKESCEYVYMFMSIQLAFIAIQ